MLLKIMTFNVLFGFHQEGKPPEAEQERLRKAQAVVRQEDPDILCITEAHFGQPNPTGIYHSYQELFGFPHMKYGQKRKNGERGNCLLSKFPIKSCLIVMLDEKTAMRAEIEVGGLVLHLDLIHPSPFITDDEKIAAVRPLLQSMQLPYVLTGDFNALSDEDQYDEERIKRAFRLFTKESDDTEAMRFLERKLIPFIKSFGLRDAMPEERRTHTIPTDYLNKNKDSAMRLDYCFVSPDIKVIDSYIVQNELAEYASDHRPIITIIEI